MRTSSAAVILRATCAWAALLGWLGAQEPPPLSPPIGGANAPAPSDPAPYTIPLRELAGEGFAVRIPRGEHHFPGGAALYVIPGPIAAVRGPDGVWRGRSYLETYRRLLHLRVEDRDDGADLHYLFEDERRYSVTLRLIGGHLHLHETADLGPRDVWVFDSFYHWQPTAGLALSLCGQHHNALYLPAYYDQSPVKLAPQADGPASQVGGLALRHGDPQQRDLLVVRAQEPGQWRNPGGMAVELWQRRQRPNDPGTRHFQAPETKADGSPNPHSVAMIGQSLYEGHNTIELRLFNGHRRLRWAMIDGAQTPEVLSAALQALAQEDTP